jgi:regulator of vacuolar morphogenesis
MAPAAEITIPTTSVVPEPKPYTIYHISVRLPLRSFTVQKRFSDFLALHQVLTSQAGAPPPAALPQKSWFARTVNNAGLTEQRRAALEAYLRAINEGSDGRWRATAAWRAFLNLPAPAAAASAAALHSTLTSPAAGGAPITDPVTWIDCHRNLKEHLRDARLHLQRRDQALTAQEQHESAAAARRCLVLAGGLIMALDRGLKTLADDRNHHHNQHQQQQQPRASEKLGEGELRRRRDLVANASKEKEALEALANAIVAKHAAEASSTASAAATAQQKSALFGGGGSGGDNSSQHSLAGPGRGRRVLGAPLPETEQTRELDNRAVLQLQKQMMDEQDEQLEAMAKGVMGMKKIGIAMNEELQYQNRFLDVMNEDVTRYVVQRSLSSS